MKKLKGTAKDINKTGFLHLAVYFLIHKCVKKEEKLQFIHSYKNNHQSKIFANKTPHLYYYLDNPKVILQFPDDVTYFYSCLFIYSFITNYSHSFLSYFKYISIKI